MKLKTIFGLIVLFMILNSCASKIMQGYVGTDVREVILDYGTPINAMDMGNGIRAFQWKMTNFTHTTPTYIDTTSNGNISGSLYNTGYNTNFNMNTYVNTNTVITHSKTVDLTCLYTLFARWNNDRKGWMVVGFKKPKILCE